MLYIVKLKNNDCVRCEPCCVCKEYIKKMTATPEVGEIYDGVITKIMDFGAFVEIMPGKEGLVHVSQFSDARVENVHDVVSEGDEFRVKLTEIDDRGRLNLSKKLADK